MGSLALLAELQSFANGGSNAGLGFAQHISLLVEIGYEKACLDSNHGFQI
jgi:hypothetical protein